MTGAVTEARSTVPRGGRALFWLKLVETPLGLALGFVPESQGGFGGLYGLMLTVTVLELLALRRLARDRPSRWMSSALVLALVGVLLPLTVRLLRLTGSLSADLYSVLGYLTAALGLAASLTLWVALVGLLALKPARWMTLAFVIGALFQTAFDSDPGLAAAIRLGPIVFGLFPLLLLPQGLLLVILRRVGWSIPSGPEPAAAAAGPA